MSSASDIVGTIICPRYLNSSTNCKVLSPSLNCGNVTFKDFFRHLGSNTIHTVFFVLQSMSMLIAQSWRAFISVCRAAQDGASNTISSA